MTYSIQITIHEINVFEIEKFTNAEDMFTRYAELIADQPSGVEIECFAK